MACIWGGGGWGTLDLSSHQEAKRQSLADADSKRLVMNTAVADTSLQQFGTENLTKPSVQKASSTKPWPKRVLERHWSRDEEITIKDGGIDCPMWCRHG